jgi:hypothetical protein
MEPLWDFLEPLLESPSLFDLNIKLISNRRETLKCVTQWVQIYVDMPQTYFRGNDHMCALELLQLSLHITWRSISCEPLIPLKRIYNFLCSMLVFTPFVLCFITLRGVFMWFLELTYWQDATVPVPYFLLFLCFRKATQEIFSELDKTSSGTPIFPGRRTRTKREPERGQGLPTQ